MKVFPLILVGSLVPYVLMAGLAGITHNEILKNIEKKVSENKQGPELKEASKFIAVVENALITTHDENGENGSQGEAKYLKNLDENAFKSKHNSDAGKGTETMESKEGTKRPKKEEPSGLHGVNNVGDSTFKGPAKRDLRAELTIAKNWSLNLTEWEDRVKKCLMTATVPILILLAWALFILYCWSELSEWQPEEETYSQNEEGRAVRTSVDFSRDADEPKKEDPSANLSVQLAVEPATGADDEDQNSNGNAAQKFFPKMVVKIRNYIIEMEIIFELVIGIAIIMARLITNMVAKFLRRPRELPLLEEMVI